MVALALFACSDARTADELEAGTAPEQASSGVDAAATDAATGAEDAAAAVPADGAADAAVRPGALDAAMTAREDSGFGGPPPLGIDAGVLRDASVTDAAADATVPCEGPEMWPCFDGVPDRGSDIGELSVSDVPRPRCPEALPTVGAECDQGGLRCGYGNRARADCRRVFECSGRAWRDASPPCYVVPPGHCPKSAAPENGASCEIAIVADTQLPVCEYGSAVTCTCGPRYFRDVPNGWACNAPPEATDCPRVPPNHGEGCDVQGLECSYGPICLPAGGRWFCRNGEWEYAGVEDVCLLD